MEEIREAALAYYENGSPDQKRLAQDFFDCLDEDGKGKVDVREVISILGEEEDEVVDYSGVFQELGRDKDGKLDFNGFLTLFYVIKSRSRPFCDRCRVFLKGLFFTCVRCHESSNVDTFDLCSKCYRGKKFSHEHDGFLDNYALLAHKRLVTVVGGAGQPNTSQHKRLVDLGGEGQPNTSQVIDGISIRNTMFFLVFQNSFSKISSKIIAFIFKKQKQ